MTDLPARLKERLDSSTEALADAHDAWGRSTADGATQSAIRHLVNAVGQLLEGVKLAANPPYRTVVDAHDEVAQELDVEGRRYERMVNRRLALETAAKVAGTAVTYSVEGQPELATVVLAAARQFAAYLDETQTTEA